ncbi:hypothetical protein [Methanobrevibacter sp.]
MECYYHPDREGTDECAICGKSICKECGLEIAKKFYCKDCLEKIVGLEIDTQKNESAISEESDENIYEPQNEDIDFETPYAPQEEISQEQEYGGIVDDSPYNIKSNIQYSGGLESSYLDEPYQKTEETPQITQNEIDSKEEIAIQNDDVDYIYPDHSYEPEEINVNLEDKYERYLDDLYFDEEEDVPLNEQLAKDEAQYGSLTRREYTPRKAEAEEQTVPGEKKAPKQDPPKQETPEEMEARIRAEILKEQESSSSKGLLRRKKNKEVVEEEEDFDKSIHNLDYQDGNEPMGIIDIFLTLILIIVILIVIYYLVYLFLLSSTYPTFLDAIFALKNPQNVINTVLTK